MDAEKIGHIEDHDQLLALFEETRQTMVELTTLSEQRKYIDAEKAAKVLIENANNLQEQLNIMHKRSCISGTMHVARRSEIAWLKQLNVILTEALPYVATVETEVANKISELRKPNTVFVGSKIIMKCLVGPEDWSYSATSDNMICANKIPEITEHLCTSDFNIKGWENDLDEIPHCFLFHQLYSRPSPPLWLEDLLRIETVEFDISFNVRFTVKIPAYLG